MANRRVPFTLEEKAEMETLIMSKKYTDEQIAKKFTCSKTTIKILRTKKYRQLKKKRRVYSDEVKQAILIMYVDDKLTIMEIARRLRVRYWTVWEYIKRSGVESAPTKKSSQHIINREMFNYLKWLNAFLNFLGRKLRIRNQEAVKQWMHLIDSQKQLQNYIRMFNETIQDNLFMEKGK